MGTLPFTVCERIKEGGPLTGGVDEDEGLSLTDTLPLELDGVAAAFSGASAKSV